MFSTLELMALDSAEIIKPAQRILVSEAAEKHRYLDNPGSFVGYWNNKVAPYLVEFMDVLKSEEHEGVIFVAPARTGKSDCFFNWLGHTQLYDPTDMMFVGMTEAVARDWSKGDLTKMFRHSKDIGARVLKANVHDITFQGNTRLLVKWPAISELSGKTMPRGWIADYDRIVDDIDGEGNCFDLASKRAQTFNQGATKYGMWVAESSPGRDVTDPTARLPTPHYAPPTTGILDLYNRGDRRRWFWRCLHCRSAFEPTFECLSYPDSRDLVEASEMATMKCPKPDCGFDMVPEQKEELNAGGKWIKDGERWESDGKVYGQGSRTDIASFWMFGPSAAFQTWRSLVYNYLVAMRTFKTTGDPGPLKKTVNTDQGNAFTPPALNKQRSPEWIEERKVDFGGSREDPVVPPGVLFLIATVDVQAGSRSGFVVQVHGICKKRDTVFVDMFMLRKSKRLDGAGDPLPLDPAAYPEDWKVLIKEVILRSYPLADESGRRMAIVKTGCDMGGAEGVANNAYDFWRLLRDNPEDDFPSGLQIRFQLLRGDPNKHAPRARISFPDSGRKDRNSGARGDVPVLSLHPNLLKDQIDSMLNRRDPGGGLVTFPKWAPDWLYSQLTGEVRTDKGWVNTKRRKNEAWDLFYYCMGLLLHPDIDFDNINWEYPPSFALEWDHNDLVFDGDEKSPFEMSKQSSYDLGELAALLA